MKFSISLSAVMLFVGAAIADTHPECWCSNGGTYNWRITTNSCTAYSDKGYQWGTTTYNDASGLCVADSGAVIAGNEWSDSCKATASAGFACADGVGTCYANAEDVSASCN
ncbi:unnamed protein product [Discula destructiva]